MTSRNVLRVLPGLGFFLASLLASSGGAAAAMPKKDAWYTQHYIIMQDFERKAYRSLSENGRKAFQDLFWAARSANARATFMGRLEYVIKTFWKENSKQPWNTDRARVYLLNGSPVSIDYDQNVDFATPLPGQAVPSTSRTNEDVSATRAEVWIYPFGQNFIRYIFAYAPPNQWKMGPTGNRYLGELEDYNKNVVFGVTDLVKYKQDLAALEKK